MSTWLMVLCVCAIIGWVSRPRRPGGAGLRTYVDTLNDEAGDSPSAWVVGFICLTWRFARKGDPLALFLALLVPAFFSSALANAATNSDPAAPWCAVWLPSGVLVALVYVRSGFRPAFRVRHITILALVSAVGAGLTDPDSLAAYREAATVTDFLVALVVGGAKWLGADALKPMLACALAASFTPAWVLSQAPTRWEIARDLCRMFFDVALIVAPSSAIVGVCSLVLAEWCVGHFSPFSLTEIFWHWYLGDVNSQLMLGSLAYILAWRLASRAGGPRPPNHVCH